MANTKIDVVDGTRDIYVDDSDWIRKVRYDVDSSTLQVTTIKGSTYEYSDVSAITFAHIITNKSIGAAFNRELRTLKFKVVTN